MEDFEIARLAAVAAVEVEEAEEEDGFSIGG